MIQTVLCTIGKYGYCICSQIIIAWYFIIPYSIPEEARLENYKGPTKTPFNLSDGDKKYIVEIYLKHGKQIINVCIYHT